MTCHSMPSILVMSITVEMSGSLDNEVSLTSFAHEIEIN